MIPRFLEDENIPVSPTKPVRTGGIMHSPVAPITTPSCGERPDHGGLFYPSVGAPPHHGRTASEGGRNLEKRMYRVEKDSAKNGGENVRVIPEELRC